MIEENTNLETESGIKLERRVLDLRPLVESLIHDLPPVAGTESTKLVNRVPDDLVAYADASIFRRVLPNLIANGIKYTPQAEVVVEAKELDGEAAVECSVHDNGAGISCVFRYIETFCNTERIHQTLGYRTPMQFEHQHATGLAV